LSDGSIENKGAISMTTATRILELCEKIMGEMATITPANKPGIACNLIIPSGGSRALGIGVYVKIKIKDMSYDITNVQKDINFKELEPLPNIVQNYIKRLIIDNRNLILQYWNKEITEEELIDKLVLPSTTTHTT
jgi:hypothetical protein